MQKIFQIFQKKEFEFFLFFFFLFLFSWPYISTFKDASLEKMVVYFFVVWFVLLTVFIFASIAKNNK